MSRHRTAAGFSLIELLVVMMIILVLAAISIPVFVRQREKAWVAQLESSLKNAAHASESYAALTGEGGYTKPGSGQTYTLSDIQAEGFKTTSPEVFISSLRGNKTQFCIEAYHIHIGSTKTMAISSEHTTPAEGRCNATNWQAAPW